MERRRVPGTTLELSCLALGGWLTFGDRLDDAASLRLLQTAIDGGINFLDLADVYGARAGSAERVVGGFLREIGPARVVVSSKVFWPNSERAEDRGLSRAHVHRSIDRTLTNLGLDQLDVYLCHREDPTVPLAETVQAMGDLVRAGKIRAWGTSCWRPETLRAAHALARELAVDPPRVEQPQYSLLVRAPERDVLPACAELGMGAVAFSPLGGGVLTGKYVGGLPDGSRARTGGIDGELLRGDPARRVARFVRACRARGLEPALVALAWVIRRSPVLAAITGATSETQLRSNLGAATFVPADGWGWIERDFPRALPLWQRVPRRLWRLLRHGR